MKHAKKLTSLLLALVLVFALATTAFAESDTYTITVTGAKSGHTYTAYQIFSGDLSVDEGKTTLSNIEWGDGIDTDGLIAALKETDTFSSLDDDATAADVAAALSDSNAAAVFAEVVAKYVAGSGATSAASNDKYTISGLSAGYYLVLDTTESLEGYDAYSDYILEVVKDVTVTVKSDVPTVEKKVKDTNDSEANSTTDWQDSADYDIGDSVPFQLTSTLGDISGYDAYQVIFHDTLSKGLTYNSDATVKVGNTTLTSEQYTLTTTTNTDGTTALTITIDDVIALSATNGTKIVVEYTATLNDNAVIGSAGNPNTVYLEYSNNPNDEGTGKTPEDKVIVFTYKVVVNKVDENDNPLTGAGFTLYKWDADKNDWVAVGEELKNDALTTFTWSGLDDGNYKLAETTTPAGYNTMADIEFTITATHDTEADDPKLITLSGTDENNEVTFTSDTSAGSLTTNVVNKSGSTLPSTGGMGTTIFYVVGSILLIGAAVLLVTKRRMSAEK